MGWGKSSTGWHKSSESGGGSSLPDLATHAGEVLAVNVGETGVEWIAVAGTGTVTSVDLSMPADFAVADNPITAAGTIAVTYADQAANEVFAGPATGADDTPGFRALVDADLGNFTLAPSLKLLTLQDAANDTTVLTARASAGAGTAHVAQFQASDNSPLSHIDHDGVWNGDVIGDVTGDVTGNADTATTAGDGLTSASGTAPLTLSLAAKALTGSVATMTAASAGSGGAAGLVPASAAGDQAKFLRADATWQTVSGGGGTPGGDPGQLQYNADGAFAGVPGSQISASAIKLQAPAVWIGPGVLPEDEEAPYVTVSGDSIELWAESGAQASGVGVNPGSCGIQGWDDTTGAKAYVSITAGQVVIFGLQTFADDTAARAGGLNTHSLYKSAGVIRIVEPIE